MASRCPAARCCRILILALSAGYIHVKAAAAAHKPAADEDSTEFMENAVLEDLTVQLLQHRHALEHAANSSNRGLARQAAARHQQATTVILNDGVEMPILAFGAGIYSTEVCKTATAAALDAGFRFIWSSVLIGRECQLAQAEAVAASSIDRSDLFIAGTVDSKDCSSFDDCYESTMRGAEEQLELTGQDPLDMLMLDFPADLGCTGILGQWKALEQMKAAGRVRTISVSNFDNGMIQCFVDHSSQLPSVNELRYTVAHHSTEVADNGNFGIYVQSYSPLGKGGMGSVLEDALLQSIGNVHGKSSAQVALRWIVQMNATIVTQSTNPEHLAEDVAIFDFELTAQEMDLLSNAAIEDNFDYTYGGTV